MGGERGVILFNDNVVMYRFNESAAGGSVAVGVGEAERLSSPEPPPSLPGADAEHPYGRC